jgi:hypothetical protein
MLAHPCETNIETPTTPTLLARPKRRPWLLGLFWALALLLPAARAEAGHFRYGTLAWSVPDPVGAPRTVEFKAVVGYAQNFAYPFTLALGDGNTVSPDGVAVGSGTDSLGARYYVFEYTTTHTYASDGPFIAGHSSNARIGGLVNGSGSEYRIQAVVALGGSPVNTAGPTTGSPTIIMLQAGAVRTFTWPAFEPDGDGFSCRFGTTAESGLPSTPTDETVPVVPDGGAVPVLAAGSDGCTMTWDLSNAVAGQRYVFHVEFESVHGGVTSSSDIDTVVEIISTPPPAVTGGGVFSATAGQAISIPISATWTEAVDAAVSTIGLPAGATLMPGASAASPFANTLDWTPPLADRGKTRLVLINYTTTTNLVGTGFALISVSSCTETCTGATPFCDPISLSCVACLSDAGCAGPTPRCSAGRTCVACVTDANCGAGFWCNDLEPPAVSCDDLIENGKAIPDGTCTELLGARVCASGVCDADDLCGWANGTSGCMANTSDPHCRSGLCDSAGTCAPLPPATIAVSDGSNQSAVVGAAFTGPLSVLVTDTNDDPVAGVTVTFAAAASGASADLSSPTAVTGEDGVASVTATANTTAGPHNVTATVEGVISRLFGRVEGFELHVSQPQKMGGFLMPATFALTNLPGSVATVSATSGSGQTQTIEMAFADPLVVTVLDAHQNPIANATVAFNAPTTGATAVISGGTLTDASGKLQVSATAGQVAGTYQVVASVSGVAQTATFTLTNRHGPPAAITVSASSTPQSAQVQTAFAQPLKVTIADTRGNPVPGITVHFDRPASPPWATLSAAQAVTGADGTAQVTATAEAAPGSYQVTARIDAIVSTVTFALTNTVGPPATLRLVSGGGQSARATTAFAAPLVFGVRDGAGNDLAGVAIALATSSGGGSLSGLPTSVTTQAGGQASLAVTAGTVPGALEVTATVTGAAAPVAVSLTVEAIPTTSTIDEAPGTTTTATPFRVSATVSADTGVPSGEITVLLDGQEEVARVNLQNGRASVLVSITEAGTYSYSVHFAAQGSHAASQSAPRQIVVTAAGPAPKVPVRVGGGGGCALAGAASADRGLGAILLASLLAALVVRRRRRARGGGTA